MTKYIVVTDTGRYLIHEKDLAHYLDKWGDRVKKVMTEEDICL